MSAIPFPPGPSSERPGLKPFGVRSRRACRGETDPRRGGVSPVFSLILVLALVPLPALAQSDVNDDPDRARIITSDVDLFWDVLDRSTAHNRAELLQGEYIEGGTVGVRDFVPNRILSGRALAEKIAEEPQRYSPQVRERSAQVLDFERPIRAGFYALKYLYPPAVFPDVYFVIGRLNSGGTASQNGLIIGVEMYAHDDEAMRRLPNIVLHEAIHFQQNNARVTNLLGQSFIEGAADFVAELAVGGHTNHAVHEFADPRQKDIWQRFSLVMLEPLGSEATEGWLYGGSVYKDGPSDLGYYVGYKICEAYYENASNKRRAIYDILNTKDFEAFLAVSGYADRFTTGG